MELDVEELNWKKNELKKKNKATSDKSLKPELIFQTRNP